MSWISGAYECHYAWPLPHAQACPNNHFWPLFHPSLTHPYPTMPCISLAVYTVCTVTKGHNLLHQHIVGTHIITLVAHLWCAHKCPCLSICGCCGGMFVLQLIGVFFAPNLVHTLFHVCVNGMVLWVTSNNGMVLWVTSNITLPCSKRCSAELPLRAGSYMLHRCTNIWHA